MALSNITELIEEISSSLGTSAILLSDEGSPAESTRLNFAANTAVRELRMTLPVSDNKKIYWLVERGKRHALDFLRIASAHKFKYKQISLNHRFEHYNKLIEMMDKAFKEAKKDDPALADVDAFGDGTGGMGIYLSNGFVYDQFGNDITRILDDLNYDNEDYRHVRV